jgi:hypothetical protein
MPLITAYPDVNRAYVRVEADWFDNPEVTQASVVRVDSVTGQCTPLRPYVCFDGDELALSCGLGIWWDTEVPLDRQFYYITQSTMAPCLPAAPIALDTFSRTVVNQWGSTDTGQPYTLAGTAADFDVAAGVGTQSHPVTNSVRNAVINIGTPNATIQGTMSTPSVATGVNDLGYIVGRFTDTSNFYMARMSITTTSTIVLSLRKRVAGVESTIATLTVPDLTYVAGTRYVVKMDMAGSLLSAKLWPEAGIEPADWLITGTDTSLVSGNSAGLRSVLDIGSGHALPFVWSFDNFIVTGPCLPCTPVTAQTEPLTMASNGAFRLRDPVRPCNDLYVPLCFEQVPDPSSLPGSGVFFASMDVESYATNAVLLNPTNAVNPLLVSRQRRNVTSVLTLVTRTFADRDDLLAINAPGSPLMLAGPPQYGIKDVYMAVADVSVERGLSDHRFPIRVNTLPFTAVGRPSGPSQGVCGSRVEDMCDIYDTWQGLADSTLDWADLIRGRASQDSGPVADVRVWDEVLAEFADWNDVLASEPDWTNVEMGP